MKIAIKNDCSGTQSSMHKIKTRLESKRGRRNDHQAIGFIIMVIFKNIFNHFLVADIPSYKFIITVILSIIYYIIVVYFIGLESKEKDMVKSGLSILKSKMKIKL